MSEFDTAANDIAVAFTTQIFRLIRSAQMHDVKSLEAQGTLGGSAEALRELARSAGGFVTALFAGETVFVNGQPVRAQRAIYENVLQVGETLEKRGFNELTIRSTISGSDLAQLLDLLGRAQSKVALPASITLQMVDPKKLLGDSDSELSMVQRVAAVYGAATVLVRRCNAQIREDDAALMRHVKRVAQRLVTLTHTGFVELLALARRPAPPTDHAMISVNAAVMGALAGRMLTDDIHTLLRITMAALQAEIGKPRVAGMYRADTFQTSFVPQLNQTMRRRLPASSAVMLLQAGRAAERPLMRAVVAYETAHLADGDLLGWPYEGQIPPTVEAVIASVATRVAFAMATTSGPDELVATLADVELGKVERAALDLIFAVLGVVPAGSPVEMTGGWRGVSLSAGKDFAGLEYAKVLLLLDEYRRPVTPQVVRAGDERGWVKSIVTRVDDLLARQYKEYLEKRGDGDLPATTGVLQPAATDRLRDRATLDFDASEATSVVDASVADGLIPSPPDEAAAPAARAAATPRAESAPAPAPTPTPAEETPASLQFKPSKPAAAVPAQFQPPAQPDHRAPKQFQPSPTPEPPDPSLPPQFRSAPPPVEEAPALPKQFQPVPKDAGDAAPNAWIRPRKSEEAEAADKKPDDPESKKDDDSSDDGDFDALANIVLFD